jgi:hypothetical protein
MTPLQRVAATVLRVHPVAMREPAAAALVLQCGAMVEELFSIVLTDAEWDRLSEVLTDACMEDSRFVVELRQRLSDVRFLAVPLAPDSRRDLIAVLAGLCRLAEARDYAQWLSEMVMRRNG